MSAKKYIPGPKPVGEVVVRKLPQVVRVVYWLARMERDWAEVVGERFAPQSRPIKVEGSVLIVACETPPMANILNLSAGTWLRRIKELYGIDLTDLRAVVRPLPRRRKSAPRKARPLKVPRAAVEKAYAEISPKIKDKNAALALARLEAAAKTRWGDGKKKEPEG